MPTATPRVAILKWGRDHDKERHALFGIIETCTKLLNRLNEVEVSVEARSKYLQTAVRALNERAARGIVEVEWPEEHLFGQGCAET